MKRNDFPHLLVPTRQSVIAIAILLIKFLRGLIRSIWPILLIWIFRRESSSDNDYFTIAVIVISSLTVISSIVAYFKYYYYVSGEDLIIERGLFVKKKMLIPADRIQSINFEQGILHQFFNVVEVKIDTAGSSKDEISLDALDRKIAEDLKTYLLSIKNEKVGTSADSPEVAVEEIKTKLINLDIPSLLKVGVSQNHLQTAGLIIAFGLGFLDDIEQALNIDFIDRIQAFLGVLHLSDFIAILIIIPILLFISFLITLIRTVLRYFDFTLWYSTKGFTSASGLFTRREKFVHKQKIQMVRWSQNPIEKLFKLFDVSLKQASSIEVSARKSLRVPGAYKQDVEKIKSIALPKSLFENIDTFGIDRSIIFRSILYIGLLPIIPLALAFSNFGWLTSIILCLIYLILVCWLSVRYQKKWKIHLSPEGVTAERGIYGIRFTAIPFLKVQNVTIQQNLHQIRRDLASVNISTASGSLILPYLDLSTAKILHDYILDYVEREHRPWM